MTGKLSPETIQKYDDVLMQWLIPSYGNAYRDALLWERDDDWDINTYVLLYGFTPRQVFRYCKQPLFFSKIKVVEG